MLTLTTRTEVFQPHRVASYQTPGDASYVVEALAWSTVDTLDAYDRDRAAARSALALGLRILRAQRNHYRQSRPAWACWCGMDTPLRKTDQCADHAPSGAYTSDRW